jgi:hypothetical protein
MRLGAPAVTKESGGRAAAIGESLAGRGATDSLVSRPQLLEFDTA